MGDLSAAASLWDELGEIVCLTFVKGVDEADALRRIGGYDDTVEERTAEQVSELMESFDAGYPRVAAAVGFGPWSVLIEPDGFNGAELPVLRAISRDTEAVTLLRHAYAASHAVAYAVDGEIVAAFDPADPDRGHGTDPLRLRPLMSQVGLRSPVGEDDDTSTGALPRALLLAQLMTGVVLPPDLFAVARRSAEIEPWFVVPFDAADMVRVDPYSRDPLRPLLVGAVEAANPQRQREVAVAEVRRQAAALGLADTPGLADLLDDAARGTAKPITAGSALGGYVRTWLATYSRASGSVNHHYMPERERYDGFALSWFTSALRGVLHPDPRNAALAAVRPLTSGIASISDAGARESVIRRLAQS